MDEQVTNLINSARTGVQVHQRIEEESSGGEAYYNRTAVPEPAPLIENKIRTFQVEEYNRGYNVRVGCHTFAFSTKEEMIPYLVDYINNPSEIEKKWFNKELFK
jgi:hypothetical protein